MEQNKGIAPILMVLIIVGVLVVTASGSIYYLQKHKIAPTILSNPSTNANQPIAIQQPDTSSTKIYNNQVMNDGNRNLDQQDICVKTEIIEGLPNRDIPSDWKTYLNTELGFQISYPPALVVKENMPLTHLTQIYPRESSLPINIYADTSTIQIDITSSEPDTNFKDYTSRESLKSSQSICLSRIADHDKILTGKEYEAAQVYTREARGGEMVFGYNYYASKNGTALKFHFTGGVSDYQYFDKIFGSLRWINAGAGIPRHPNVIGEDENNFVYHSEKYGFQVTLPKTNSTYENNEPKNTGWGGDAVFEIYRAHFQISERIIIYEGNIDSVLSQIFKECGTATTTGKRIIIDGAEAKQMQCSYETLWEDEKWYVQTEISTLVEHGGKVYEMNSMFVSRDNVYQQILDTFKFIR